MVSSVAEGVQKNLRFSTLGDAENSNIGKSILFLGMLMDQFNQSNDTIRVNYDLFEKIKEQSRYDYTVGAIIIQPSEGVQNLLKTKSLQAKFYDFRTGQNSSVGSVYLLPQGGFVVLDNNNFYYPIGKLVFSSNNIQIAIAYRTSYSNYIKDPLSSHSVKQLLREKFDAINRLCIDGALNGKSEGNGLRSFFNMANTSFEGFSLPNKLTEEGASSIESYNRSLELAYETYLNDPKYEKNKPILKNCYEAVRGTGMILATAAILNGHFTPMLVEGMEK